MSDKDKEPGRLLFYGVVRPLPFFHLSSTCHYLLAKLNDPQRRSNKIFRVEAYENHTDLTQSGFYAACPFCSSGVYYNLKINGVYHQLKLLEKELTLLLYMADCIIMRKEMSLTKFANSRNELYRVWHNTEIRIIRKGLLYRVSEMPVKRPKRQRLLTPLGAAVVALYNYRKNIVYDLKDNNRI